MDLREFLKIPFDAAIEEFTKRNPVLAESAQEVRERYALENIFALVRSTSLIITKNIQKAIEETMRRGLPTEKALEFIRRKIRDRTQLYAETVFRTNLNTAYNAGRQREAMKHPAFVVGFEFNATFDSDVRPNHKAAHGLRAPTNHPVWDYLTPPLGYNCRCVIRQITRPEAERKGWLDEAGELRPWHPRLGYRVSPEALISFGAKPDYPEFGRRAR